MSPLPSWELVSGQQLFCPWKIQEGVLGWGCLVKHFAVASTLSTIPEV